MYTQCGKTLFWVFAGIHLDYPCSSYFWQNISTLLSFDTAPKRRVFLLYCLLYRFMDKWNTKKGYVTTQHWCVGEQELLRTHLLEQQAPCFGLKVVEPCRSERVFTRAYPFWYLYLNNSLLYLKPLAKWKERGMHWKETKAYRLY